MDAKKWLKNNGFPDFPNTVFRKESAPFTTPFGHDFTTFADYRYHAAVDRGHGTTGQAFVPFDCSRVDLLEGAKWKDSFGTLLRLFVDGADFEFRLAHFDPKEMNPEFLALVKGMKKVKAGTLIGRVGNLGRSAGRHTHTEVVSIGERSEVLDEAMKMLGTVPGHWHSNLEIQKISQDKFDKVLAFLTARRYLGIGDHDAQRHDYIDGKVRTWYDSKFIFNGV